jgi:haloacetate dehalogenase
MTSLGHRRFHVVGHDRGARVGHRLARDHGSRVRSYTALDVVPTLKMYSSVSKGFATAYYHWFFLIQKAPLPENLLKGKVPHYIIGRIGHNPAGIKIFADAAMKQYERAFRDPKCIHATCEDYRAGASIDLVHDRKDARRKIRMPVLALWGKMGVIEQYFQPLRDWREFASDVRGRSLDCGHFLPEEKPAEVLQELRRFFARID